MSVCPVIFLKVKIFEIFTENNIIKYSFLARKFKHLTDMPKAKK